MTEESGFPSSDPAKRNVLNLDLLLGPKATVHTSIGTVDMYSLRASDISEFRKLRADDPAERVREFLPCIASLSERSRFKEQREPLPSELAAQLTEADLDALATVYASPSVLGAVRVDSNEERVPPRQNGETAAAYLDRLLQLEIKNQADEFKKMWDKTLASGNSIFDQVRKSSSALGSTLTEFERLKNRSAPVEIHAPNMDHIHAMNEQFARQARERAEELEMVRLTGKMTAESAKTLKDLAEAATILLEQLDERDEKADLDTRKQLRIAVWSVIVSAVLALIALVYSGASYYQDKANNAEGDKWQKEVLSVLAEGYQHQNSIALENKQLKSNIEELTRVISTWSTERASEHSGRRSSKSVNADK